MKEVFPGTDLRKKAATMKRKSLFRAICSSLPRLPVDVFEDVMHQFLRNEHFEGFVVHDAVEDGSLPLHAVER